MEQRLRVLVEDLYRRSRAHDQAQADRLNRWRNVEPDTAKLMSVLIRALSPMRLLELGTSNGYSTIWLADAARATGGSLISVELDPARSQAARENLRRAALDRFVELRVQDAGETLASSGDESWDFIFLDAERSAYPGYWPDLRRVLSPRGLLIVDNVISHAHELSEFRGIVAGDAGVTEALAPTGAGALLIAREPATGRC